MSFTEPGATVLLLPWPAARDERGETVPPAAVATVAELKRRPRSGDLVEPTDDDPGHPRPNGVNKRVDLVVTVMPARPDAAEHTDRVARLAAAALRLGGVLTVLTHCDRARGVLVDLTGPMVTAGQNADLLYLQHVVAVHLPPADLRRHDRQTEDATDGAVSGHRRVHSDVLVFAQPHDNGARPSGRARRP
jgi:hypothetical protein